MLLLHLVKVYLLQITKKDETNRNSLMLQSLSIVKKFQPGLFVFENVRAFLQAICVDDRKERTINNVINEYFNI
ncbi:hypothetical protein ATZ36_01085 [Candidatus Endomicrobiellum trichonymphae]|uniref:Uncharacterized protein n=1 Tax=Endomicrobium trichonymphae TaxID=1408204 RepID=A0A1E5IIU5_ENDTX|nr:hypothetical protein ATZ36_01085 [Candidatus Endomicrobium trichonymphae]